MILAPHAQGPARPVRLLAIVVVFACFCYAVFVYRVRFDIAGHQYFTLLDDAMISMRYARNLAAGSGLVWNSGETPVQGITNLGWTLLMAAMHKLPVSASVIPLLVMAAASVLLLANALLSYKIVLELEPTAESAALAATVLNCFYFPLVYWSLRGMEVAALVACTSSATLLAIKISRPTHTGGRFLQLTLVLALALLTRLDSLLQVTLILAFMFSFARNRPARRSAVGLGLVAALLVAAILYWQYQYYGSLLPNTYYLKVVGVPLGERLELGIRVFVEYASRDFAMLLLVVLTALALYRDMRRREYLLLLELFAVQCLYSIYVGGDFAEPLNVPQVDAANRFIVQGMPSLIVLFALAIERMWHILHDERGAKPTPSRRRATFVLLAMTAATLFVMSGEPWVRWVFEDAPLLVTDTSRARLGIHIKMNTDPRATIAAHAVGNIAYYSERRTVDLLGPSDAVVARGEPAAAFRPGHNKWNYEYSILSLRPDIVADEWGSSSSFLSRVAEYHRLQNGIWVRRDTTLLDIGGLQQSY